MENKCPFCYNEDKIILENKYFYLKYDKYPVSKGHLLAISKHHNPHYFYLSDEQRFFLMDIEVSPDSPE